jgi:hypothetical protein
LHFVARDVSRRATQFVDLIKEERDFCIHISREARRDTRRCWQPSHWRAARAAQCRADSI